MRRSRSGPATALLLPLRRDGNQPLYRQLYAELRDAVLAGRLAPGTWLPSSRVLAGELGVSRNTVVLAFDQLVAEGYLEGSARSGTRVAASLPRTVSPPARRGTGAPLLSRRGRALAEIPIPPSGATPPRPFRAGAPALDEFPRALWARLAARHWRRASGLSYGEPAGLAPLREAIAEYVRAGRGARCSAEQVIVVNGSQQGVDLAARVLLDPGDMVWMEDPGYQGARAALVGAGAQVLPVPVDDEGLMVEAGRQLAPGARLVYVSPSHQFPLGITMSAGRRLSLLAWAAQAGAWVLEDDYDSEFRYDAHPLACLQGMDQDGRVVYVGTFSKTLCPALRLGYLIVPEPLVDAFRAARSAADRHSPTLDQAVLADFLAEGHFARHVRRMRRIYLERQDVLVSAIHRRLGGLVHASSNPAGMHLVGWLAGGRGDVAVAARAAAAGVEAAALSGYSIGAKPRGGLLLGYAGFRPDAIRAAVDSLAAALN